MREDQTINRSQLTSSSAPRLAGAGLPRSVELTVSLAATLTSMPVWAVSAALLAISSGPILFRQQRVGKRGRIFTLLKFRTMHENAGGPQFTPADDSRVTRLGRILRKTKLDELPQLWNVLCGDMALVGPRPEVPRYVDLEDALWKAILEVRPGIADPSAFLFRNEEELLEQIPGQSEDLYVRYVQRYKLIVNLRYLESRSWLTDIKILTKTLAATMLPGVSKPPKWEEIVKYVETWESHS